MGAVDNHHRPEIREEWEVGHKRLVVDGMNSTLLAISNVLSRASGISAKI